MTTNAETQPEPTHEVTLVTIKVTVFVTDPDTDDEMLNAAAVGQNVLSQTDVVVKRLSDGHTETFPAMDCRDWWA